MAQFIKEAVKRKGALKSYAVTHRLTTQKGTIDLDRTKSYIEGHEKGAMKTRRLREVNLAMTLRRLRA